MRLSITALILATAIASGASGAANAQAVGKLAPALDLSTGAKPVRLADLRGRVVYLDFWASWCGPCKQSFPWMNEMQAKYGDKGLTIIGVTTDQKREDADKFLALVPAKFTIAYDPTGKAAEKYQPKGMPTSFLIGADGVVRAVHVGFRDGDREELEREIAAALTAAPRK